ncbi:hypothetical protein SEA_JEMERALD_3 [Microbacterium phage Jemerald]|nr:hypothetical protein SEA_JUICER_3 [Microbacterium phage Juicer]WNO27242.1 hypothetical protein SEA_JEMERALD_3 [Microbacterium phage Jemerald]
MTYTVHNAQGLAVAGDSLLTDNMRDYVDDNGGHITDDNTGDVVYPEEG